VPQPRTVINAFLASPSDVSVERSAIKEIVAECNRHWAKLPGIYLELICWENNAYPGIGDDAQDVINNQIPNEYDIFIGIMGTRFGTPTKRATSGTAEEFERAFKRNKSSPNSVSIMFYVSEVPLAPSKIEPEQLHLINDFKKLLQERGVLYWPYQNLENFKKLVRSHLNEVVNEWGKKIKEDKQNNGKHIAKYDPNPNFSMDIYDELGIIELQDIHEEVSKNIIETSTHILGSASTFNQELRKLIGELGGVNGHTVSKDRFKKHALMVANLFDDFRETLIQNVSSFKINIKRAVTITGKRIEMEISHKEKFIQIRQLIGSLYKSKQVVTELILAFYTSRESINRLQEPTKDFKIAKKKLIDAFDTYLIELNAIGKVATNRIDIIEDLIIMKK